MTVAAAESENNNKNKEFLGVMVRLASELTLKSDRVRARFLRKLAGNIAQCLRPIDPECKILTEWSYILIKSTNPEIQTGLERIPGIHSFSPIVGQSEPELEAIIETGTRLYGDTVQGKHFAVRARRRFKKLPFGSQIINERLGSALASRRGIVNLSKPELTIQLSIQADTCYFLHETFAGLRGLPLGTGGRALCLLSGGFDSAIAAWAMQRRGITVDYLLCHFDSQAHERAVLRIAKILNDDWSYGHRPRLFSVDISKIATGLAENAHQRYLQVLLKRTFYRIGNIISNQIGAEALVTGEALAQVSSQTLPNLCAIEEASKLPIMRPLICSDKEDIIDIARKIGTYDLSAVVPEYCQLVPKNPATACTVEIAKTAEEKLDLSLEEAAVAQASKFVLNELTMADLTSPFIFVDKIPEDAVVIDCRTEDEFEDWHFPQAQNWEFYKAFNDTQIERFNKKPTYVIYCPAGVLSAVLAEKMQSFGYTAYSLKGGLKQAKQLAVH